MGRKAPAAVARTARRRAAGPRLPQRAGAELLDRGPLLLQEPAGLVLLAPQTGLLGLMKTAVLVQQVMLLDGPATTQIRFRVVLVSTQT